MEPLIEMEDAAPQMLGIKRVLEKCIGYNAISFS